MGDETKPSSGDAWLTPGAIDEWRNITDGFMSGPEAVAEFNILCDMALAAIKAKGTDPQREALVEVADAARALLNHGVQYGWSESNHGVIPAYRLDEALRRLDASEGL